MILPILTAGEAAAAAVADLISRGLGNSKPFVLLLLFSVVLFNNECLCISVSGFENNATVAAVVLFLVLVFCLFNTFL